MVSITPAQLGAVLDVLSRATLTVGQASSLHGPIQALLMLANQPHPIGAVVPVEPKLPETVPMLSETQLLDQKEQLERLERQRARHAATLVPPKLSGEAI